MNVLFIGERNIARSIMAEAIARRVLRGAVAPSSAGRNPGTLVSPYALETLKQAGYDTEGLTPKSWNSFVNFSAPNLHVVVTLDDALKRGPFPIWYSAPVHVHWSFPNPEMGAGGDMEKREAYRRLYGALEQQMLRMAGMDLSGLKSTDLKNRLQGIAPAL